LLRGGERGQAFWWMLAIFPLFLIAAAITVDASIWLGHRRVYQKTADASALAGAQELLSRTSAADMTSRATEAADQWMARNNRPPAEFANGTPEVVSDCWGMPSFDGLPDGVIVDVSKEAPLLFMRAFGVTPFDIGAHAKVCVGSPQQAKGLLPFGVPAQASPNCFDEEGFPLFTGVCDISIRVPAGESGEAQYLRLYDSNSVDPADWSRECSAKHVGDDRDQYIQQIIRGARTWCAVAPPAADCPPAVQPEVGYCVDSLPGNRAGWLMDGMPARLTLEGQADPPYNCDALYDGDYPFELPGTTHDGIDQWWEAVQPAAGYEWPPEPTEDVTFVRRDCTAPRLVTLVLIKKYAEQGQGPYPIIGFAGFFIKECYDDEGNTDIYCRDRQHDGPLSNQGHVYMKGYFMNYVDLGGPGGPATPYGRMQLYMVE
jgi:hypothetical protein